MGIGIGEHCENQNCRSSGWSLRSGIEARGSGTYQNLPLSSIHSNYRVWFTKCPSQRRLNGVNQQLWTSLEIAGSLWEIILLNLIILIYNLLNGDKKKFKTLI